MGTDAKGRHISQGRKNSRRKLVSCQNRWCVDVCTSDRQDSGAFQGSDRASLRLSLRLQGKAAPRHFSAMVSDVSGHTRAGGADEESN